MQLMMYINEYQFFFHCMDGILYVCLVSRLCLSPFSLMATKKEIEQQLQELELKKRNLEIMLSQTPEDPEPSQTQLEIEAIFKECMSLSEKDKADPTIAAKFSAKVMGAVSKNFDTKTDVAKDIDTKTDVSIRPSDSVSQAQSSTASSTTSSRSRTLTYELPYANFIIAPNVKRFVCFCVPNHGGVNRNSIKSSHLDGVEHEKAMKALSVMPKNERMKTMLSYGWAVAGDDIFTDKDNNKVIFHP